jgi:MAF protein
MLAVFIAAAAAVNMAESLLPRIAPWMKLGLANLITLISLILMGGRFAMKVAIGRVFFSSIILGTFLSPTFYLSFGGAAIACAAMILFYRPLGRISPIGVSVIGAVAHILTQLMLVYLFLVKHEGIFVLLPILLVTAVIAGIINGYLAIKVVPVIAEYSNRRIFLASASPRRINILKKAGLPVIVVKHKAIEDDPTVNDIPIEFALTQARKKMDSIWKELPNPGCVISSDTIVEIDNKIFIKPDDEEHAKAMLETLGGREQKVHTAVIFRNLNTGELIEKIETTRLKMKRFTEEELEHYKGKHLDKAGGYAIQGMSDKYIEWIKGSYTNVIGFPVEVVRKLLKTVQ